MTYLIYGIDAITGADRKLEVDGDDEEVALKTARSKGVLPYKISGICEQIPRTTQSPTKSNWQGYALVIVPVALLIGVALILKSTQSEPESGAGASTGKVESSVKQSNFNDAPLPAKNDRSRPLSIRDDPRSFYNGDRNPPYLANESAAFRTRDEAISALASQFGRSKEWVISNMGASNDLIQIHENLTRSHWSVSGVQVGTSNERGVNQAFVNTYRERWRREGWRTRPRSEQGTFMLLMILKAKQDIPREADQEETLDFIRNSIDQW